MRIFGLCVVRNEEKRYLDASLRWMRSMVDELVVFDDCSQDDSREIAERAGALVGMRTTGPTFLENESQFRQSAWWWLETALEPTTDDFVVSIDADEFIVDRGGRHPLTALREVIEQAHAESCEAVELPVAEVFGADDGVPLVRIDGEWGRIRAERVCRWPGAPVFRDVELSGGSLPKIAGPVLRAGNPTIMHLGYLRPADRLAKYDRYKIHRGLHNPKHVDSIAVPGKLEPWPLALPEIITEALQ